jgi:hypothetical protein
LATLRVDAAVAGRFCKGSDVKAILFAFILVSPVAAQTIGGPHKPNNQIGGPTPLKNLAVAHPRGIAAAPSIAPTYKPPAAKIAVSSQPSPVRRGAIVPARPQRQPKQ